jgi:glycosyltransferase involved in cell wall biosynthesis
MRPRLYYLGEPADGFGWGVANINLVKALLEFCDVVVDTTSRTIFDAPVFVPVINHSLKPLRKVEAPKVLGYCFTEWPIGEAAHREARQYDVLFAGSTWNKQRLEEAGCRNVRTLIQGVDFERFTVQPWNNAKPFIIFSGGKFEFRKGQDYVIAALRLFMAQRQDTVLISSWHNDWIESVATMCNSWLLNMEEPYKGLPEKRFVQVPKMPNAKTPAVYGQAHIGLFPNRCEAGTNLVMCEFMACGRPVIASYAHGHKDVLERGSQYLLTNGSYDPAGWFNPNVSDIIAHLEHAYRNRDQLEVKGMEARMLVEKLSWRDCARKIMEAAFGTVSAPGPESAQLVPALG